MYLYFPLNQAHQTHRRALCHCKTMTSSITLFSVRPFLWILAQWNVIVLFVLQAARLVLPDGYKPHILNRVPVVECIQRNSATITSVEIHCTGMYFELDEKDLGMLLIGLKDTLLNLRITAPNFHIAGLCQDCLPWLYNLESLYFQNLAPQTMIKASSLHGLSHLKRLKVRNVLQNFLLSLTLNLYPNFSLKMPWSDLELKLELASNLA